ncbi:MAG TPA: hypothetical protein VHL34_19275 [Rhizomicrobium sp.]|jgi:hypothetical protein|nr:hypothetical protein [Rhizomicrobium sp.]
MRIRTLLAAAALLGVSVPVAAGDLIYHYKSGDPDILSTFGNDAYWKPMARCAGIYTSIAVRLRNAGQEAAAKAIEDERTIFMQGYATRLTKDRGISVTDAMAVAHDELINSASMMDDARKEDANAEGELITQCEKAYNLIQQYTAGQ